VRGLKQGAGCGACQSPGCRARPSCSRARAGLMALLAAQLFARLAAARAADAHGGATVHMTAFEIVNERVTDLLAAPTQQLRGQPGAGQTPQRRSCCARRGPRLPAGWQPAHTCDTPLVIAGTHCRHTRRDSPRRSLQARATTCLATPAAARTSPIWPRCRWRAPRSSGPRSGPCARAAPSTRTGRAARAPPATAPPRSWSRCWWPLAAQVRLAALQYLQMQYRTGGLRRPQFCCWRRHAAARC